MLFRNVATIKELTDIFVLDEARLVDQSSRQTNSFDIVASDDDFILSRRTFDLAVADHLDTTDTLFTKEVIDGEDSVVFNGVRGDRKVSIYESHLVFEALGNTSDHVSDVRENSLDTSNLLTLGHPGIDNDLLAKTGQK